MVTIGEQNFGHYREVSSFRGAKICTKRPFLGTLRSVLDQKFSVLLFLEHVLQAVIGMQTCELGYQTLISVQECICRLLR